MYVKPLYGMYVCEATVRSTFPEFVPAFCTAKVGAKSGGEKEKRSRHKVWGKKKRKSAPYSGFV
jgi:hypothetical protein